MISDSVILFIIFLHILSVFDPRQLTTILTIDGAALSSANLYNYQRDTGDMMDSLQTLSSDVNNENSKVTNED